VAVGVTDSILKYHIFAVLSICYIMSATNKYELFKERKMITSSVVRTRN